MIFLFQKTYATSIVKADTVQISGYSNLDTTNSIIYGGIAGNACAGTSGSTSTCNSCTDTSGGAKACNQSSVYPGMKFSVSFSLTQSATNAVAKLYIVNSTSTVALQTLAAATYSTADTITLETTWAQICANAGLSASCTNASALLSTATIKFGVGADNSGDVDASTETKSYNLTLHYIPAGASDVTQALCADNTTGVGTCNITFAAGDEKVFIDTAIYNGADTTSTTSGGSIDWDGIAVFPLATPTGSEATAYSSFSNGLVQPVVKGIDTSGNIPDSQVSGGIANYQQYCMVYGSRNKAQNIYKFVTTGVDTTKSCVTPSEVVGLLDDKHCFISTAAFGSQDAPEVEIFRKFRNQFLLKNILGKLFVKTYYQVSPPLADIISGNEYLKASTRVLLYPLLVMSYLALKIGFFAMILSLLAFLFIVLKAKKILRSRAAVAVMILVLVISPILKAEIVPDETTINKPEAAQEGLVRIKKDGTYVYDLKRALKTESSTLTLGQANFPDIAITIEQVDASGNPTGGSQTYNFKDFYNEESGLIVGYNYNWFPYTNYGKLGVEAGISGMFVSGHGKLVASPNPDSKEAFTFITLPLTLGGVYRMEWKDKQLFAPYVSGGGAYVVLIEKREDKPNPNAAGSFGFYGTAGMLFNLSALDSDTGFQLDSEYGISNLWLSLEFKAIEVEGESFTFSNRYVNAGLSFDF